MRSAFQNFRICCATFYELCDAVAPLVDLRLVPIEKHQCLFVHHVTFTREKGFSIVTVRNIHVFCDVSLRHIFYLHFQFAHFQRLLKDQPLMSVLKLSDNLILLFV